MLISVIFPEPNLARYEWMYCKVKLTFDCEDLFNWSILLKEAVIFWPRESSVKTTKYIPLD